MSPPLPSLSAVRAFEAAARHLSFSRAAGELRLTQGAVSHQVRELEDRLGAPLFRREGRGVTLTEAGQTLLPHLREALASLRAGLEAVSTRGRADGVLTVSVSPNFATKWLVPRLGRFAAAHPDLDLRISATPRHVDFAEDGIDVAIRHGEGGWPELHARRLCAEEIFPVCSPAYLRAAPPLSGPEDLPRHALVHAEGRDAEGWRRWLAAFAVDGGEAPRGPVFSEAALAIDAAVAGQGVALARSALASLDLASGRLVRPVPQAVAAPFSYWIVCPKPKATAPKVARFEAWLVEQADLAGRAP